MCVVCLCVWLLNGRDLVEDDGIAEADDGDNG